MIEFRVLGATSLSDPSGHRELASVLGQPKRVGLLAYLTLATESGFINRNKLMGIFWPESSQDRARHSLNQSVHWLRQALGAEVIVTNGDGVRIDHAELWCDATAFQQALDEDDTGAALELYTGELLPGQYLSGCGEFEMWLEEERARLKHAAEGAVSTLVDNGELDPTRAISILRRALSWNRYDERTLRRLVSLLVASGDRADAVLEYQAFRQRLAEDLAVDPSLETETLMEELRENHTSAGGAPVGVEPLALSVGTVSPPATPHAPDVVRRSWFSQRLTVGSTVVLAAVLVIGGTCMVNGRPDAASLDPTRVLVTDFENRTGRPELATLGRIAGDWMTSELARTGMVDVVPPLMVREKDATLDPGGAAALALARATNAGLLVSGAYYLRGDSLLWHGQIAHAGTGEVLRTIDDVRGPVDRPLESVELLRQRMAGVLATILDRRPEVSLRVASQPPSYPAYQRYAEGLDLYERGEYLEAADVFLKAVDSDSTFTSPIIWAARAYSKAAWADQTQIDWDLKGRADSLLATLESQKDRLAPWDRAWIDLSSASRRGDMRAMYHGARRMVELNPEPKWRIELALYALALNRPSEAVEALSPLDPAEQDPTLVGRSLLRYSWTLGTALHRLGQYQSELEVIRVPRLRQPHTSVAVRQTRDGQLRAFAALHRDDEVHALVEEIMEASSSGLPADLIRELQIHGYDTLASKALDQRIEALSTMPFLLGREMHLGILLYRAGRWQEAYVVWQRLLVQTEGSDNHVWTLGFLGRLAARRGDREEAAEYSRRLETLDLAPVFYWSLPYILAYQRAQIAILLDDRNGAVEILRAASNKELFIDFGKGHMENNNADLAALKGYAPYDELVAPRPIRQIW